jgi:hypothetical protein
VGFTLLADGLFKNLNTSGEFGYTVSFLFLESWRKRFALNLLYQEGILVELSAPVIEGLAFAPRTMESARNVDPSSCATGIVVPIVWMDLNSLNIPIGNDLAELS